MSPRQHRHPCASLRQLANLPVANKFAFFFLFFLLIFRGVLVLIETGVWGARDLSPGVGTCDNGLWEGNGERGGGFGGQGGGSPSLSCPSTLPPR